jgi:hypothetical protein
MKKVWLILFLSIRFFEGLAQVDSIRREFFNQIIQEFRESNSKYDVLIKVRGDREPWDTTGRVFLHYFTRCDTTDKRDLGLRNGLTRKNIRTLANLVTERDYAELKTQIVNQYKDDFYPKKLTEDKRNRKIKGTTTLMFSQPLIATGGDLIFLITESRSTGFYARTYQCYKRVNGKWAPFLILYQTGWVT